MSYKTNRRCFVIFFSAGGSHETLCRKYASYRDHRLLELLTLAGSRYLFQPRRAFFPELAERASRSRMSISSTSSESSCAVTDSWRVKDTSVAVRRCSVNLAMLWALVVTAYLARAFIRLAGTVNTFKGPTFYLRTSISPGHAL